MAAQLDTPDWRSAELSLSAEDPLNASRIEAWHRGGPTSAEPISEKSTSVTDSLLNPEALLGESLTGAGLAGRFVFKMPFAQSMSWGVTALGKALTEYSVAQENEKNSAAM